MECGQMNLTKRLLDPDKKWKGLVFWVTFHVTWGHLDFMLKKHSTLLSTWAHDGSGHETRSIGARKNI